MKIDKSHSAAGLSAFWIICVFVLCGFTTISDVETAIIEKDFKHAKTLAEEFISKNPSSLELAQATYYLGLSELGQLEYPAARTAFNQVMELNPSESLYEKAWLGIIDSLGMEENFEEDLAQAEKFLKERPKSEFLSVIYLKLGRANLKLSRWAKAQTYLKKVVSDFPQSFEAHTARQLLDEQRFFAIQVGSFLDRDRAIALTEELKSKGEYAYLLEIEDHEGRAFYRVRVGQFKSLADANDMRKHLSDQGYPTRIYP